MSRPPSKELIALEREIGLEDRFYDYVPMAWPIVEPGTQFVDSWSLGCMCEHLQAAVEGEIRKLVINVPPGNSKSRLAGVLLPSWVWPRDPDWRWIYGAYGDKLVNRDAKDFRSLCASDWYTLRWGDRVRIPSQTKVELVENLATGWRLGTTPGGEVTGFHGNAHVIDDPIKPEELSDLMLTKVREWRKRTMSSRWRRAPGEINTEILIMQRLHCDDLSAQLIEEGAVHLRLPVEFNSRKWPRCETKWGRDPREDGELLNETRFPREVVDEQRRLMGPLTASAQLDQDPIPAGGAMFKAADLRYWAAEPGPVATAGPDAPPSVALPKRFDFIVITADCSMKDEEQNDPVALQVWGRNGPNYFLLAGEVDQMDLAKTCRRLTAMRTTGWGKLASYILVEDKANGPNVIKTLEKRFPGVMKVDPKRSKVDRAMACTPMFDSHNVYLPDPSMPGYSWVLDFILELVKFPRARHDDQVDAMGQAILFLHEKISYLTAAMAKLRGQRAA